MDLTDPLRVAQALIRCASITPDHAGTGSDGGAMDLMAGWLQSLGFEVHRFDRGKTPNLYARLSKAQPNLCFAGHTDVVPPGNAWSQDPFGGTVEDGILYGRGAVDMKGGIAAFLAATARYLQDATPGGALSFLITGDEEGEGLDGTESVLKQLAQIKETIEACIVGEPTNPHQVGDMIKNGRRGSVNATLKIKGKQGHVAYPHLAENPVPIAAQIITLLKSEALDEGTPIFQPSNLEITGIHSDTDATNVIPGDVTLHFNIRFNTLQTPASLENWVRQKLDSTQADYDLVFKPCRSHPFETAPGNFTDIARNAIRAVTNLEAELSTSGGTSDARFMRQYCPQVIEFGLINRTMHKSDECVAVADLETLTAIYQKIIAAYFAENKQAPA